MSHSTQCQVIRRGGRIRWPAGSMDGYASRIKGQRISVVLDNGSELVFTLDSGVIEALPFEVGDQVTDGNGLIGVVIAKALNQEYQTVRVAFADGTVKNVVEMNLRPGYPGRSYGTIARSSIRFRRAVQSPIGRGRLLDTSPT